MIFFFVIKIGVTGSTGRMAQALQAEIKSQNDCKLSGFFGKNAGSVQNMGELFEISDIVIDFTTPYATMECLKYIKNKTFICGTTGLNSDQIESIKKCGQYSKILLASNMSFGVAVIQYILKNIVPLLKDFDVEIVEKHHNKKADSPSGTALSIGKNIANIKGIDFDKNAVFNRSGIRKANDIGFASIRGGTVAGEHTIGFFGDKEVIEITHKAENRDIFAIGAVKLAKIVHQRSQNGFFEIDDIISSYIL